MCDPDVVSACTKILNLMESEPQEIGRFMKGEIADGYCKMLQKELEGMNEIKKEILSLMDQI